MTTVTITRDDMLEAFCVYRHVVDGQVIFIGLCELQKIWHCPDARSNLLWLDLTSSDRAVTVDILHVTVNVNDAMNWRYRYMAEHGAPPCNVDNRRLDKSSQVIKCIETGETFETQAQVISAHQVNQGQLSMHLNRKAGYRQVKGRTYEYVPAPAVAETTT